MRFILFPFPDPTTPSLRARRFLRYFPSIAASSRISLHHADPPLLLSGAGASPQRHRDLSPWSIIVPAGRYRGRGRGGRKGGVAQGRRGAAGQPSTVAGIRSEEHTSELQSR